MKKTKFSKMAALLLAVALIVTLVPVNADAAIKRKVALYTAQGKTLKAAKGAKWKSSNKSVAAVSKKGKVTAKKAGKAVITAKRGKRTWKFAVTVKNPYLARKQVALLQGENETVKMVGATVKSCSSSNTGVAAVTRMRNAVRIRAVGAGGAVVSVKASDGNAYSCSVAVNASSSDGKERGLNTPSPSATMHPVCQRGVHEYDDKNPIKVWYKQVLRDDGEAEHISDGHGGWTMHHNKYYIAKCKFCDAAEERHYEEHCDLSGDYVVTEEPTCTRDGHRYHFCPLCGSRGDMWTEGVNEKDFNDLTTIPHLGHDFEYTYKREITVQPGWTNRDYPGATKNVMENPFGERTATCKRCHNYWDEVGIDTGTELNGGSREIVWGVWRQDKNEEILKELNAYRTGRAGVDRSPLQSSEVLNRAAVYVLAEKLQMWTTYGSPDAIQDINPNSSDHYRLREIVSQNFLSTKNCYDMARANTEYDISKFTTDPLMNTAFLWNTDIKYAGVACFEIETDKHDFYMGVLAGAKSDENLSYECNHCSAYEFMADGSPSWDPPSWDRSDFLTVPCLKCKFDWVLDPDDPHFKYQ